MDSGTIVGLAFAIFSLVTALAWAWFGTRRKNER